MWWYTISFAWREKWAIHQTLYTTPHSKVTSPIPNKSTSMGTQSCMTYMLIILLYTLKWIRKSCNSKYMDPISKSYKISKLKYSNTHYGHIGHQFSISHLGHALPFAQNKVFLGYSLKTHMEPCMWLWDCGLQVTWRTCLWHDNSGVDWTLLTKLPFETSGLYIRLQIGTLVYSLYLHDTFKLWPTPCIEDIQMIEIRLTPKCLGLFLKSQSIAYE